MEPYLIYMGAAFLGGIFGTVVPYGLKVWENGKLNFDYTYCYGLIMSTFIMCVALIPDTNIVDIKTLFIVFLAGLGLNTGMNKMNRARIRRNGG